METPKSDSFIKFRTFKVLDDKGDILSRIIVAFKKSGVMVNGQKTFEVGMSFCSPEDDFIKAKGRLKARGRLAKGKSVIAYTVPDGNIKDALRFAITNDAIKRDINWMAEVTKLDFNLLREVLV